MSQEFYFESHNITDPHLSKIFEEWHSYLSYLHQKMPVVPYQLNENTNTGHIAAACHRSGHATFTEYKAYRGNGSGKKKGRGDLFILKNDNTAIKIEAKQKGLPPITAKATINRVTRHQNETVEQLKTLSEGKDNHFARVDYLSLVYLIPYLLEDDPTIYNDITLSQKWRTVLDALKSKFVGNGGFLVSHRQNYERLEFVKDNKGMEAYPGIIVIGKFI